MRRRSLALAAVALLTACSGGGPRPSPNQSPSQSPSPGASVIPSESRSPAHPPPPGRTPHPTPTPSAPSSSPYPTAAQVVWRLGTTRRVVALTFDAGSDAGSTSQILDLLEARRVVATFGLTGAWVRANPALAARVVADGHLVVNHTDGHLSFTGRSTGSTPLTRAERGRALAAAEAAIRAIGGVAKPWFRPPYGDRDASVDRDVAAFGYRVELMWTVDTLGWQGLPPSEVVDRVVAKLVPGEIVLMHVGASSTDARALPALLDTLRSRGYGFVRADRP